MAEGRDDRIELMKKDKTELIRNIRRAKRKRVGSLDSIDALWPDEGSTDKERRIKEELIKRQIRHRMFMMDICFQIFVEQQNLKPKEVKTDAQPDGKKPV